MNFSRELLEKLQIVDWAYTDELEAHSYDHYDQWVLAGHAGPLNYLVDERKSIRKSLSDYRRDIQSALVFLFSYAPTKKALNQQKLESPMASYVLGFEGKDYHHILRDSLSELFCEVQKQYPDLETKISLDTQPILERDLALRAGLGWFGKNSMLINRNEGSFFILGSLLLNKKLPINKRAVEVDHCGSCTRCITACPTNAIDPETRTIRAKDCISTYTIEQFHPTPAPKGMSMGNGEVFGCDICQDVCPWNEKQLESIEYSPQALSNKSNELLDYFSRRPKNEVIEDLEQLSNRGYRKLFSGTPLERTGRIGMLKNFQAYNP